ncbi:TrkH family potassium uptake protein [Marinicellulosiphila megalodicopiae]|uniref:TrkH family potassium uptake protein n=1 Tax=Marinicellulosiphila megalodicopiae TaxID=2724896 RepID=UPI003BAE739C
MHLTVILRVLGVLLMLFSFASLPSAFVSLWYQDHTSEPFFVAFGLTFLAGLLSWFPVRKHKHELRTRDGFLIVVLFWLVLGFAASLPLYLAMDVISFTDAFFEAFSGLTTTGATVIVGLDDLPKSILFYRQQLQWLGGIGIVVLAVAVLPMLGVGGMQLYRAETPGPVKDSKLTPRITETAKALSLIYLWLTIICAVAYKVAGMSVFDAICHAFSTVAIGGYSTHDLSIGYFDSWLIESIAVFFMLLASANFSLHFFAWRKKSIKHYFVDAEFKFFLAVAVLISVIAFLTLAYTGRYEPLASLRHGVFESVSVLTTTGFGTESFSTWPLLLPILLFSSAVMGGCAGSTAGGMKVSRVLLIIKQGYREIKRLIHPQGVFPIKLGKKPVSDKVVQAVWGFFSVYTLVYIVIMMLLMASGLDFETSWSAAGASLNNLGPGLGTVADNYKYINDFSKWVLCLAMLLGRLEIFTLLVVLTPMFWRR